jgi:uncharacterized protein YecE (DUF72 family)
MLVRTGTSGFSYKEWKGSFYPDDLPAKGMLAYYASHLGAVEINNTFYRMPKASVLESWVEQVPGDFRFALKASRRITHFKRLKNVEEEARYLIEAASTLGENLAALLFQLPPNLKKDVERLRAFLEALPPTPRAAFEFRHSSWFDDDVFALLADHDRALCIADADDGETIRVATAGWGYLRLRRQSYRLEDLEAWRVWIDEQSWTDVMLFFKHEDEGAGPKLAARYLDLSKQE